MPILNLQFKSNNTQSFLDLSETLQVCTKVARQLEHGQRLDNLGWRISHIQSRQAKSGPDRTAATTAKKPIRFQPFQRSKSSFTVSALRSTLQVPFDDIVAADQHDYDNGAPTYEFIPSSPRPLRRRLSSPPPPTFSSPDPMETDDDEDPVPASPVSVQEPPRRYLHHQQVYQRRPLPPSPAPSPPPRRKQPSAPTPRALNAALRTPNATPNAPSLAVKAECANCGATQTPLWRRGLNDELNCNACGLYCKMHKRPRPLKNRLTKVEVEEAPPASSGSASAGSASGSDAKAECINCHTTNTPLWRRDEEGRSLCNACGLYFKLHGTSRPISLKSDVIKKRTRPGVPPKKASSVDPRVRDLASQGLLTPPLSSESESDDLTCFPFPGPYHPNRIFALARKRKPVSDSPLAGPLRLRKHLRV